jgi:hypothetical protein
MLVEPAPCYPVPAFIVLLFESLAGRAGTYAADTNSLYVNVYQSTNDRSLTLTQATKELYTISLEPSPTPSGFLLNMDKVVQEALQGLGTHAAPTHPPAPPLSCSCHPTAYASHVHTQDHTQTTRKTG